MTGFRQIRWVLVYTMILNLVVTVAKLLVGYATGTLSLVADGFHSLFDSASNVVGLVGIQLAARPPDPSHPYGHRKFETLSAVTISLFLFVTTIELLQSAIARLRNPSIPEVNWQTFGVAAFSIAMQLYVASYERKRGRELKSQVLVADALHSRSDVLVSAAVLLGMGVMRAGLPIVDAILPLVIAVLIAKSGVEIIRDTSKVLVDAAALDVNKIHEIVTRVPGVHTTHNIRSRGQEGDIYLDLHVQVQEGMPVEQAHHIAHQVKRQLIAQLPGVQDVVVHIEPQEVPRREAELEANIREIAGRIPHTAVHSIQAHEVDGRPHVTLHLEVDSALSMEQAHALADQLEDMLRNELPQLAQAEVHIEPAEHRNGQASPVDEHTRAQIEEALRRALQEIAELDGCHDLAIFREQEHLLLSVHCECDARLSVEEAHALSSRLEQRLQEQLPPRSEVTVHVEPRRS